MNANKRSRTPRRRIRLRLGAPDGVAGADDHRWRRHVRCVGGAAGGAAGFRRGAGRRLVSLHPDADRLWHWRHPDGAAGRPLRRDGGGAGRRCRPRGWALRPRVLRAACGSSPGPRTADRPAGRVGHVRAAGGRHLAVVHPPPGHRGGHLHERQLSGRRGVAAGDAALHRQRRLAATYFGLAIFCVLTMAPLALFLRRPAPWRCRRRRRTGLEVRALPRPVRPPIRWG
jgi:hypothetical protein